MKQKSKYFLWVILLLLALVLAAGIYTGHLISQRTVSGGESDYVIVLGCTVEGTEPSVMLQDRINAAYAYLQESDAICIVSGGMGDDENITEAQCMFNGLTAMGIDADRIWLEDQATSTLENLEYSMALIEERTGSQPDHVAVLSSEFHLYRAQMFAREMGLDIRPVYAASTRDLRYYVTFLREILLIWYYSIF